MLAESREMTVILLLVIVSGQCVNDMDRTVKSTNSNRRRRVRECLTARRY